MMDHIRPEHPTLKDVAKLAKTSPTTASRALAGHPHVREDVRLRVLAAAEALNYRPNREAQALRAARPRAPWGPDYQSRQSQERESKIRIGQYTAAQWIRDGDVIALDSGTTVQEIARALNTSPIVYTYAIPLLEILGAHDIPVFCAPGRYNPVDACNIGDLTVAFFRKLRIDRAFLSCYKFDVMAGPSNLNESMDRIRQAIAQSAEEVIIVVDHSKFTDAQLTSFIGLGQIRAVITDFLPDRFRAAWANALEIVEVHRLLQQEPLI
jgi:DeoR/GlpR family transcriptional regulator of sugar metabolism